MNKAKWYEDNAFWHNWGPMLFSSKRYEGTPEEVDHILSLTGILKDARILDLCCGPGRHSLELARRGFSVTGIDRYEEYLDKAREAAGQEGLKVEFIRQDMRDLSQAESYDLVLSLFTSFGYFENDTDDQKVMANIYRSLKTGGQCLLDMSSREVVAKTFQPRGWTECDGMINLEEREIIDDFAKIRSHWILFKDNQRFDHTLIIRLYSAPELKRLLQEAGFCNIRAYGGLDGSPYDDKAKRLVVAGYKR